tara:strand:+ start:552814 stop:556389 length:3576 start_codon:yes stop_codon:yes gene_type:complete
MLNRLILVGAGFLLVGAAASAIASSPAESNIDFSADVRPILSDHCFACHGPDEADRQAGLRLDTEDGLFGVVTAGDVDESDLLSRVMSADPDEQMPPPKFHKPLSQKQITVLKAWIAEGAEYQQHWAFVPPQADLHVGVDAIDTLIDKRIKAAGLDPNGIADRRSLIRRVCLDLTGLPPTRKQVAEFLADETPDAYENLVDRLLQSPRYGEHMGRYWLDLVRYGDTHGLHLDNYREMWPYRDWVIDAFNQNMPMDQFITEQLAGDLLPEATRDQLIASGFNRLNVTTNEGGSIYEEVFARNVMDRTDAFGTVFLGLTTGCAVCHDHKFDPISQRDYYSLSAFFNSLDGRAMDGNDKAPVPTVFVPDESQTNQLASYANQLNEVRREMRGPIPSVDAAQAAWQRSIVNDDEAVTQVIRPIKVASESGVELNVLGDGSIQLAGEAAKQDTTTIIAELPQQVDSQQAVVQWQTLQLEALCDPPIAGEEEEYSADDLTHANRVGASSNGNAVLSEIVVETAAPGNGQPEWLRVPILHGLASHEQSGDSFTVNFAFDKKTEPDAGWAVGGHDEPGPRTAWFIAPSLMGQPAGTKIRIQLQYKSQYAKHQFKRVRLSVSDAPPRPSEDKRIRFSDVHLVGPMPIDGASSGYARRFGETSTTFDFDQEVKRGEDVFRWTKRTDLVPVEVNTIESLDDQASVTLIHQTVDSPSEQTVQLMLGSDDGHQVFLNGKQIGILRGQRTIRPLRNEYSLNFRKGENHLFFKLVNHAGNNELTYAFRSPMIPPPESLVDLLSRPEDQRTKLDRDAIRRYYREVCCLHPDWLALQDLEKGLVKSQEKLKEAIPTTLVWKELDEPREAHLLMRGQYDQPGEVVPRATPGFLPPMQDEWSRDRLGLATWLTSADHPLTARVAVNRFWQQVFGVGLVKTSEDFGSQGEPPSHPELLDALAIDFRETGWDVKRMMKQLVMTKAYRRDYSVTEPMKRIDPENRLYARGPRHRLDAEVLRDQALAISGLLANQLGGKSVKPPQPEGLWYAVGYTNSNTASFTPDTGDRVYRRSVYIFWKRTSSPPQMSTFDAPSRESCTARRERTNTPLQALLLMNETQYLEASKHFAKRALDQPGLTDDKDRIKWMFETVTIRPPSSEETNELIGLLSDLQEHYRRDSEAAKQLAGDEETTIAPWVLLASTLLNLDEVVSK